jgi:chromosome segregation ATPase
MTTPQSDPAQDIPAALARLAEQTVGLQRQIRHLEEANEHLGGRIENLAELTEAKFITYRTLVDAQAAQVALALDASKEAINKAETATGKAIDKAAEATEKRFDAVNEFRAQLSDQATLFMPRAEAQQLIQQMTLRTRELADQIPSLMTRAEALAISDRNSERVQELTDRLNRMEGRDVGVKDNKGAIIAVVAVAVSIISAVSFAANAIFGG